MLRAVRMTLDWDCDCGGWEDVLSGVPPPPPPVFDLPPPPAPPTVADDLCTQPGKLDTCPALTAEDTEYRLPDGVPFPVVIAISAAVLTAVIIIIFVLFCRYKKQQKLRRFHKASDDVAVARSSEDAAIYDELLSYNPHIRLPSYEMADVVKSPCHFTTYPLLSDQDHYAQYQDPDFERSLIRRDSDTAEPVYEELELDGHKHEFQSCATRETPRAVFPRDTGGARRSFSDARVRPRGNTQRLRQGQLTLDGPRDGGGVKAKWREVQTVAPSANSGTTLYRGRCPPEDPPVSGDSDDDDQAEGGNAPYYCYADPCDVSKEKHCQRQNARTMKRPPLRNIPVQQ